jgi:site-specific DNA recombinase
METKKSVGIWIRVSTEDQAKGESPEHHEKRAKLYAEAKGWNVLVVYHLEAVSGKSVMHHSETKKMLQDIQKGHITGIIFSKLARLARNTKELLDFAEIFRENNADLISLQEAIDTSTPAGRLFYTMIAGMAQWEREEIAERVAVSVPIRAKLGKPLGGQASFGYKWENKQLVINENEAPIRKLIYTLFLKHKRKKTTADELNKMGYRTRNGSPFSDTTIHRLLCDPTAKGQYRANYTKSLGDGKKWEMKPEKEWVMRSCPAIVETEVWDECEQILEIQKSRKKNQGKRPMHLLSGYVQCICGKRMYVFHDNNVFACKACKVRIASTDLDEIYHDHLKEFLLIDSDVTEYLKKTDDSIKEKERLLEVQRNERDGIRKKIDSLINMRINEEISRESFIQQHKPIEEQFTLIENELPMLEAEIDFLKIQYLSSDTAFRNAKELYNNWYVYEFERKRSVVESLTNKIQIGKEDIHIHFANLSNFQNAVNGQRNFRDSSTPPT